MRTKYYFNIVVLLSSLGMLPGASSLVFAEQVGQLQYTRGVITMQNLDGSNARLVAKNAIVQRGEVIGTGPKSFTIVKLKDGSLMTIRPNSAFSVEQFNPKQDKSASATLRLFRGGLRVKTGYISKKNPRGYQLQTDIASIGIRDAEFDLRLCQDDCEEENSQLTKDNNELVRPGMYASVTNGKLNIRGKTGIRVSLKKGQAAYVDVLGRQVKKLAKIPMFQQFDAYPRPDASNPAAFKVNLDSSDVHDKVCEIK